MEQTKTQLRERERERDRDRDRDRQRQTETETDRERQTDRQTQTDRERERQTKTYSDRQAGRQTETETPTDRQNRDGDRWMRNLITVGISYKCTLLVIPDSARVYSCRLRSHQYHSRRDCIAYQGLSKTLTVKRSPYAEGLCLPEFRLSTYHHRASL